MMRQKLALVVKESESVSLNRMNGFSPVTNTRLGSALIAFASLNVRAAGRSA
jgi:hypothetical protein